MGEKYLIFDDHYIHVHITNSRKKKHNFYDSFTEILD